MPSDTPITPPVFAAPLLTRARAVLEEAAVRGLMIATAESCTGGLIAGLLTDIPGSSVAFDRGFVTYSNDAKHAMLGVGSDTLATHGAVSEPVARAMALGALNHSDADVALSVTGIAGPGGGSPDKPVGLVHLAVAHAGVVCLHRAPRYGDLGRAGIRLRTIEDGMEMLCQTLRTCAAKPSATKDCA